MCGLAGWYSNRPADADDRVLLQLMLRRIAHRGPDDTGEYLAGPIRLGHNRLSIIDLDGGHQPMRDASGRRTIVYNGEIYNFSAVRDTLPGYPFATRSDTEVLLAAWDRDGWESLRELNGMFAFALWDESKQRLFLGRDRMGIKPLYYTWAPDGAFVFGSEIKVLLSYPGVRREPRLDSISSYLSYRGVPGTDTFFEGIHRVSPGTVMEVRADGVAVHRYWELPVDRYDFVGAEDLYDRTEALLRAAVERRMISDVPVGAFLSGGLDSSLIVSMMSAIAPGGVRTYSIGFPQAEYNELSHARSVAKFCGSEHREFIMNESDYIDRAAALVGFKDEPLAVPNEIALFELSKFLRDDITVVLSGEGADELFGGYGRIFRSADDFTRMNDPSFLQTEDGRAFRDAARARYGVDAFADEFEHFVGRYAYMAGATKHSLFRREVAQGMQGDARTHEAMRAVFERASGLDYADRLLYFFQHFHLENLLRRVDMTTMANSVEARVPFVDHELVEHVTRIPFPWKLRWRSRRDRRLAQTLVSDDSSERCDIPKYVLKKIADRWLPDAIIARRKMGFPVPLDHFGQGALPRIAREVLCDGTTTRRGWFDPAAVETLISGVEERPAHAQALNLWMLINVETWMRLRIDADVDTVKGDADASDHTGGGQGRAPLPADTQYAQEPA